MASNFNVGEQSFEVGQLFFLLHSAFKSLTEVRVGEAVGKNQHESADHPQFIPKIIQLFFQECILLYCGRKWDGWCLFGVLFKYINNESKHSLRCLFWQAQYTFYKWWEGVTIIKMKQRVSCDYTILSPLHVVEIMGEVKNFEITKFKSLRCLKYSIYFGHLVQSEF